MMTARRGFARRKAGQQGYALLLVIFVATILLVFATMAAPNIKTEGQREKEKEMIWRGGQVAGQVGGLTPQGPAGTQPPSPGNPPATSGNPVSAEQGTDTSSDADPPIPSDDPSPIIGGNIIGVGSKINRKSVIVYDHAKNYRLFEFIWDPSKDMLGVGQPGMQTGTGLGQPIGQPIGQPAGPSGGSPGAPPPQNPQNPQQQ